MAKQKYHWTARLNVHILTARAAVEMLNIDLICHICDRARLVDRLHQSEYIHRFNTTTGVLSFFEVHIPYNMSFLWNTGQESYGDATVGQVKVKRGNVCTVQC
ncbi:hypothetical protein J437_LFUL013054 [Ladona fulva]|uniref:Uncharacterized protein n=1 Tax=Ladona fulva TaxID=123851 RepID=A0A8K0KHG2_LADFU|nr:hypothetical protein J437_LFUL013054 [Ladona fulva]